MMIEKIELNKIKVTLFFEDLQMYNINTDNMKNNSPELHIFLCEVMKKVRLETNFNPYDGQVVVEATPFDKGLILMVSKLEENKKKPDFTKIRRIRAVKKTPHDNCRIYKFESFDNFCSMIKNCVYIPGRAELYKLHENYYILNHSKNPDARLTEFSNMCTVNAINSAFLKEHGELIAKNEKLAGIVNFIRNE